MGSGIYFFPPQNSRFFAFFRENVRFKKSVKLVLLRGLTKKYNHWLSKSAGPTGRLLAPLLCVALRYQ